jgi:DNA-nicking Smr family endonuclease
VTRGKRGPSAEEEALFVQSMKDTKPLAKRERHLHVLKHAIPHLPQRRIPHRPLFSEAPAAPIGGHVEARARRGRAEVEGRFDLHGLTQDRAYRALLRFLLEAQADGKRLVLVITGKSGVLRNSLPLWLGEDELKSLVAGVSEAHPTHGGAGAFYVALRRPKRRGIG